MKLEIFLLIATVLVQLTGGEDLYWVHNTNWDEPSNWALGRVPCGGDTVSLPNNAITFVNDDVTVGSIILPEDGVLILKPSVTIRLSEDAECSVPANTEPMAADVKENQFIATSARWWECAENWLTADNFPAEHPPCGEDNAIFEMGSTFSVGANESITVRSITVRGTTISSANLKDQLDQKEFNLSINIEPKCGESPHLCPCPSDAQCPQVIPTNRQESNQNMAGIAVGVVVVAILVIVVVVFVIIIVILCVRYKRTGSYRKDDFLEEPSVHDTDDLTYEERNNPKKPTKSKSDDITAFDNPIYDSNTLRSDEIEMIGYETKPEIPDDDGPSFKPTLDDYQLTGEMIKPTLGFDFDKEDTEEKDQDDDDSGVKPALNEYQRL